MTLMKGIHVIGILAALAAGSAATHADMGRKDEPVDRNRMGVSRPSKSGAVRRGSFREEVAGASQISNVAAAMTICPQPASNCQSPDTTVVVTSDRESYYVVAEDFTPQESGGVTQVCWRGAYWDFDPLPGAECPNVSTNRFEITYYEDADGVPGTQLATFSQLGQTLVVTGPEPTGNTVAGGRATEYEYTATHASVSVAAGECYWIEITNELFGCSWLWEASVEGNGRSLQDGDGTPPLDGYDRNDLSFDDMMFCLDVVLGDSSGCTPARPANNTCEEATPIAGDGSFAFDSFSATMTGPNHAACLASSHAEIDNDLWYCWTAECDGTAIAWTCDLTGVDTKIAVYDGCGQCPPTDGALLACNDDRCDVEDLLGPRQSLVTFKAVAGRSYLVRLGTYVGVPGGTGSFSIGCNPPDRDDCPGPGNCCAEGGTGGPGCGDEVCCETVCICDSFCCEVEWVPECALNGYQNYGCGAELLCLDSCAVCGNPGAGDCCTANEGVGCSDAICCETVCAEDPFCCEVIWDENCATHGFNGNGNGAADLCPELCGTQVCPDGPVTLIDTATGFIDARQPHLPSDAAQRLGIDTIVVGAPAGADNLACWRLCHSAGAAWISEVTSVVPDGAGRFTLGLSQPLPPGATTKLTYAASGGEVNAGILVSHPGNVNGDGEANAADIETMINCCLNQLCSATQNPQETPYRCDIDHSGVVTPADLLREIDVLNGADEFDVWLGTALPGPANCPP